VLGAERGSADGHDITTNLRIVKENVVLCRACLSTPCGRSRGPGRSSDL